MSNRNFKQKVYYPKKFKKTTELKSFRTKNPNTIKTKKQQQPLTINFFNFIKNKIPFKKKNIIKNFYIFSKKEKKKINNIQFSKKIKFYKNKIIFFEKNPENFYIKSRGKNFNFTKRRLSVENFNKVFMGLAGKNFLWSTEKPKKHSRKSWLTRTRNDGKTKRKITIMKYVTKLPEWFKLPIQIHDIRSYFGLRSQIKMDNYHKFIPQRTQLHWKLFNCSLTQKKLIKIVESKIKNKKIKNPSINPKKKNNIINKKEIIQKLAINSRSWRNQLWIEIVRDLKKIRNKKKNSYKSWIQLDRSSIKASKSAVADKRIGNVSYSKYIRKISHILPLVKIKYHKKINKKKISKQLFRWFSNDNIKNLNYETSKHKAYKKRNYKAQKF